MFQFGWPIESVLFQSPNRGVSRIYTPPKGAATILTAVPTVTGPSETESNTTSTQTVKWDGNPDTFTHPLLRRYSPPATRE